MATDPVATAASNNPLLSTLVSAVSKAGLVDTLNSADALTVFAPTNDAFAKIPSDTLNGVLADKKQLTTILDPPRGRRASSPRTSSPAPTRPWRATPSRSPARARTSPSAGDAKVLCGNIPTANATVYVIDTVLVP